MVKKYTNIKERVLYVAENKGVAKEKFLESIGMTYGSFKGKAKEGTLNSDAIEKIYTIYPDVSIPWLLTGEGDMLKKHETPISERDNQTAIQSRESLGTVHKIPYFEDIQVTAGPDVLYNTENISPSDWIYVPNFQDCDVSFPLWGDSMWPKYENGQIVLCKEFHEWRDYVPYGEVFLVVTDSLRTIKYVKRAESNEHLLLVSENKHYEDFEVPKSKIRRMYFVKGAIRRNMI